ncbi:MAG: hypothetical protein U9Q89_05640, partial [Thermodesulfobacteriota bacterium]|nr:hypothetical protein [Thermodesulfobacteriota bacterium]
MNVIIGILHLPVYTFPEKACSIKLNAEVKTGNEKLGLGDASTSLVSSPISSFKFYCQNTRFPKCKLLLTCREGCLIILSVKLKRFYRKEYLWIGDCNINP